MLFSRGVLLSKLADNFIAVKSGILRESSGNDFETLGEGIDNELLLSLDLAGVIAEELGQRDSLHK